MRLLLDGDILVYRVGFACDDEEEEALVCATVDRAVSGILIDCPFEGSVSVFISGENNFRNEIATTAPYKGNREGKRRPVWKEQIREHLVQHWDASVSDNQEADDDIAIEATKDLASAVIISIDKDFLQVPCRHWNFVKQQLTSVTPEEGLLWFYQQILIGDRIDNIIGSEGIGPVKSRKLLEGKTEAQMWGECVKLLGHDRALENGRLLWLRRKPNEIWKEE